MSPGLPCRFPAFQQAYSTVWIYQTRGWVFVAFDPALFSTPVAMNNIALSGLDIRRLNWTAVNMSYYNSSDYLVDVSSGSSEGERRERGYVLSGRGFWVGQQCCLRPQLMCC